MEHKSRSQRKREVEALQKLGERLVALPPDVLRRFPLSPDLRVAVRDARTCRKHEARRRQMQYIGVLMRRIDPAPIREAFERLEQGHDLRTQAFHEVETWGDEIMAGSDELLDELADRFPGADRRHLHRLALNARRERDEGGPPKAARALFRYLRDLREQEETP